jgi:hypothetical protein
MDVAAGVEKEQALRAGGFNDQEVANWKTETAQQLQGAGFQRSDIEAYFGGPQAEPTDLKPIVHGNLKAHLDERTPEGGGPAQATTFGDAFWAGLQGSSGGLVARNKLPDIQLPPDPSLAMKIAAASGQMAGDLPAMWAGSVIGAGLGTGVGAGLTPEVAGAGAIPGAVAGAGVGAFALPAMLRRAYMDDLQKGAVKDFSDFYSRLAGVAYDGIKGGVTGLLTVESGGLASAGMAKLGASATSATLAARGAELATMTTVGKALEGEVPKPEDFAIGAITLAGFHGVMKASDLATTKVSQSVKDLQTKLQNTYAKTGIKPMDALEAAAGNPVLKQQLLSKGTEVPEILKPEVVSPEEIHSALQPAVDYVMSKGYEKPEFEVNHVDGVPHILDGERTSGPWSGDYTDFGSNVASAVERGQSFAMDIRNADGEIVGDIHYDSAQGTATVDFGNGRPKVFNFTPESAAPAQQSELSEPHPTLGEGFSPPSNIRVNEPPRPPELPKESVALSPQEQVHERVGEESAKPKLTFDKAYTAVFDRLNPIKNLVDAAKGGKTLGVEKDPFALFRLAGASDGKADAFVRFGPRDVSGVATGTPGLKQIFKDAGGDVDGLIDYAIAKHSLELEAAGKKTGVPQDAAKALVQAGAAKFEKPLKSWVQFQNDVLRYLRDSGVITSELHDQSVNEWKSYVPFNRVDVGAGSGKGPGSTMPIKAIHGSDLKLVNPLESTIRNTFAYLKIADLNRAKIALVDLASKQEGLVEKVPTPMKPIQVDPKELQRYLDSQGVHLSDHTPTSIDPANLANYLEDRGAPAMEIWRPLSIPVAPDEMAVMRDGKREVWSVGEDVAKAALADTTKIPAIAKTLALPSKILRVGAIDTIDFLARHWQRDITNSYVYSVNGDFNPLKTIARSVVGLGEFFREGKAYQDWIASGGGMSNFMDIDRSLVKDDIYNLSKKTGLIDKTQNVIRNPLELGKLGLDMMHYIAEGVVSAPRIGEFKLARELGKSQMEAAYDSRNVTLDNQRMGAAASIRLISTMKAFWNTRIQGLDKMVRSLDPRDPELAAKTAAKFAVAITLPQIALWFMNKDNEEYQNAPRWKKDMFFFVPTPWGGHALIPKPFEAGQLFGSLPERMLNDFYQKDPDAFKGFGETLAEGASLGIPYPDFMKPMIEQFGNKSLLTGGNLISEPLTKMSPEYQYNPYTSQTAKALGNIVGHIPFIKDMGHGNITLASPMIVQNYIRSWTGGMGMYALDIVDKALEMAGITERKVWPKATLADMPVIKSFVLRYPSAGAQPIQDFYDNFQKAQTRLANVQGLAKRGEMNTLEKYMASPQFEHNVLAMGQVQKVLGEQSKLISWIYDLPGPDKPGGMSPDEKRQQIDGIYYMMISTAKQANETMRAVDAAIEGAPK